MMFTEWFRPRTARRDHCFEVTEEQIFTSLCGEWSIEDWCHLKPKPTQPCQHCVRKLKAMKTEEVPE